MAGMVRLERATATFLTAFRDSGSVIPVNPSPQWVNSDSVPLV